MVLAGRGVNAWVMVPLLAALAMLGPFAIDAYLPAFASIARSLGATAAQMQQTLSAYLLGFAFMNLFHGALADRFGRRPVVLWGVGVFALASLACALAQTWTQLIVWRAVQGLATGAGSVVSRALIRDLYPGAQGQRVMSRVMMCFALAPVLAPMMGGQLSDRWGWRAVFVFLALFGAVVWWASHRYLPETLRAQDAQPLHPRHLLRGYVGLLGRPAFLLLALATGVSFNGIFIYVLAAPAFLGELLRFEPTQFYLFFMTVVAGMVLGAWASERLAGRVMPARQMGWGFGLMSFAASLNVLMATYGRALPVGWMFALIALIALGWSLLMPAATMQALDLAGHRRGLAASLLAVVSSAINALVAGLGALWVMHSIQAMAWGAWTMTVLGWGAWALQRRCRL